MKEMWARMSSAAAANLVKWDIELSWILRVGAFTGVRAYSAALAWAKMFGLPIAAATPTNDDAGTYWNKDFKRGADEDIP